MKTVLLTIYLLNPQGQVQPPVIHEHIAPTVAKAMKACEDERKAHYSMKDKWRGWKLVSAECSEAGK